MLLTPSRSGERVVTVMTVRAVAGIRCMAVGREVEESGTTFDPRPHSVGGANPNAVTWIP